MGNVLRVAALEPAIFGLLSAVTAWVAAAEVARLEVVYACAFLATAALVSLAALRAGRAAPQRRETLPLAGALATVVALAQVGEPATWPVVALHGALLIGLGLRLGATLGREVVDPAHLWPLVLVAGAADLFSVVAPIGVTRAILDGSAPVALSAVVLHLPIEHGAPPAPLLGIGDLLFAGFLGGAAARLDLDSRRSAAGFAAGFVVCLGGLFAVAVPLPALPFLGVGFAAVHGTRLRPRPRELALALGVGCAIGGVGLAALATR
jgi:hypothetical protein